ncbi:hypothetical protein [Bradyrhizobium sp.]|jgi:hypothetical protein|nr:hypothetical protein [Bradyrhizobium sp.]
MFAFQFLSVSAGQSMVRDERGSAMDSVHEVDWTCEGAIECVIELLHL